MEADDQLDQAVDPSDQLMALFGPNSSVQPDDDPWVAYNLTELLARRANPNVTCERLDWFFSWTALHFCAFDDLQTATFVLIDHGANVDAQDRVGRTPLYIACRAYNYDLAKILIDLDADVSLRSDDGRTPFDLIDDSSYFSSWSPLRHEFELYAQPAQKLPRQRWQRRSSYAFFLSSLKTWPHCSDLRATQRVFKEIVELQKKIGEYL